MKKEPEQNEEDSDKCPECGGSEFELVNYSMMWHDGDVVCIYDGTYIRSWDAG